MSEILNPHDDDLESVILGACLTETTAMVLVGDKLSPEMFYETKFGEIYSALLSMYHSGKAIDLVTVRAELASRGKLEAVGGAYELVRLAGRVASSAHLEYHALILRQMYIRREMIAGLHTLLASAADESVDLSDALADLHRLAGHLESGAVSNNCLRDMERLMQDTLEQMDKRVENNRNGITGIPTGLRELDRLTAGWQQGDLNIIAARPSMGKTSFLLNIIEHIALNEKKPTLLFSCEMPAVQIVERLLFARSGVRSREIIKRGNLTQLEMKHFKQAVKEVGASQLVIDDTAAISINELRAKARRVMRDQGGLAAIGVDYLQLMRSHSKQAANSREREVAEISAGLKALAKELKVPVIVLAQLNRGPESRTGASLGVPRISDLRESGSIEQDADMIGLLYRSAYYAEDEEKRQQMAGRANLHLAKNRNGPTGDVPLHFEAELMRFSTREADEHDQESE